MLLHIVRNEWRGLAADRTLRAVAVLLTAVMLFGALNGVRWSAVQADRQAQLRAEEQDRIAQARAQLEEIAAGGKPRSRFSDPRNPAQVGQTFAAGYAQLPAASLAPLSFGQSDLLPSYYKVTQAAAQGSAQDPELLSLSTDKAIFVDPLFKPFAEKFAASQEAFFESYAKAHKKLSELGSKFEPAEGISL